MLYLAIVSLFTTSESGMDPSDGFCILCAQCSRFVDQKVRLYTMFPICVEERSPVHNIHNVCTNELVCILFSDLLRET